MNDDQLSQAIENYIGGKLHPYGSFDAIDCWAEKDGQLILHIERKTRLVPIDRYPTFLVDSQKWLGLLATEFATSKPAILFAAWSCGSWGWVRPTTIGPVLRIDIVAPRLDSVSLNAGVPRPVVHIPVDAFTMVGHARAGAA